MRRAGTTDPVRKRSSHDETLAALVAALPAALGTLERLMACGDPKLEVKAARSLLSFNEKIEEARLAARVETLERRLQGDREW